MKSQKFPISEWSKKRSFRVKLGKESNYHIAVFADPKCQWCERFFEEVLTKLNDLEIDVFLTPVLGEESEKLSVDILTSPDPAKAWVDLIMEEKQPAHHVSEEAQDIIEANIEQHEKLGLETVPTIYLANGSGPYGFMTALELVSKIEQEGGNETEKGEHLVV